MGGQVKASPHPLHNTGNPLQENNMKTLRQLCVASVFTLALTMPTFAGEIETPKASTPPPASSAAMAGDIETTFTGQAVTGSSEATAADSATEIALNLLQSVLSLF
jgi:hypothetical protein